jgi:hypothetical protein
VRNLNADRIAQMSAPGLPLQLTVPCDTRFHPLAIAMARKVAESMGFAAPDAAAIGRELADQATAAIRQGRAGGEAPLDLRFDTVEQALHVQGRCAGVSFAMTRPLPGA